MTWNTTARIKTEYGRRFMAEQRTRKATHGHRADARLFEIDGTNRVNIESLNADLYHKEKAVEDALDKIPFHLDEGDEIVTVERRD